MIKFDASRIAQTAGLTVLFGIAPFAVSGIPPPTTLAVVRSTVTASRCAGRAHDAHAPRGRRAGG